MEKTFKYQQEINDMLKEGASMPELYMLDKMDSYRYVFRDDQSKSNLPAYIIKPKRKLKNPKLIGYSLSCFVTSQAAEDNYNNCLEHSPNFGKIAGDSLAEILLDCNDGKITAPSDNKHFSLFEYRGCDLNSKTHIIRHF